MYSVTQLCPRTKILIIHRTARIQQNVTAEIGLLFIFFHEKTLSFAKNFPVDMLDFITGIVWTMLGKLYTKAVMRTFVQAGDKSLNNFSRAQFQGRQL